MTSSFSRRAFLASASTVSMSGWLSALASQTAEHKDRKRSCILLWMAGGPAQTDTFDPKPDHANQGPFKAIQSAAPGVAISEHLPKIAEQMKHLAVIRSMKTKEGDHGRATYNLRTGNPLQGAIEFPTLGSLVAKEHEDARADLPAFVSITPRGIPTASLSAGFLGPRYAPLIVGDQAQRDVTFDPSSGAGLKVENLQLPENVSAQQARERFRLLQEMQADFMATRPGSATQSHHNAYDRAARLMRESAARAFDLGDEKASLRDRYGRNNFGQGCLLARRLVEREVPFVEVTLAGWDTHDNNFNQVKNLSQILDNAWRTLIIDLQERGLLDSTLIVWMGEFGRTPTINPRQGRDHYPNAWSVVLGGGGIKGGQAIGKTSKDGMLVDDRAVGIPDLLATICLALGLDPKKQNMSNVGRPIRLVDPSGAAIQEALA